MTKTHWRDEPCIMDGCDRNREFKGAMLCNRCYHFVNYWKNQTVTALMKRKKTLDFWNIRMDSQLSGRKVAPITKSKKRRKVA